MNVINLPNETGPPASTHDNVVMEMGIDKSILKDVLEWYDSLEEKHKLEVNKDSIEFNHSEEEKFDNFKVTAEFHSDGRDELHIFNTNTESTVSVLVSTAREKI